MASVIIALLPAYNEEERISDVVRQTYRYVDRVLVCDDGSDDSTYRLSVEAGAKVIRHEHNLGYGASLRSLFLEAGRTPADVFVTVDSDGQHDPRFIPALAKAIFDSQADIVIGSRFVSGAASYTPPVRRILIKLITRLCDPAGIYGLTDLQSGFRAYTARALSVTCPTRLGMGASTEIIKRATGSGLRIREVPVPIYYDARRNPLFRSALQFLEVFSSTLSFSLPRKGHEEEQI
jgi:glycosyltransferase involved in cell wall biosynthesis